MSALSSSTCVSDRTAELDHLLLTPEEIYQLTHKRRYSAQVRALQVMGIEYRVRPDRTLAIHRAHIGIVLGAATTRGAPQPQMRTEPNWAD
jgi:hypothetical protein